MRRIFITGGDGYIGKYLIEQLRRRNDLFLILLLPSSASYQSDSQMMVIVDDLLNIRNFKDLLSSVDVIIHLAATWESEHIERVNLHPVSFFLSLQKRFIYFSTESILDPIGNVDPYCLTCGRPYIETKARAQEIIDQAAATRTDVYTIFPTVILDYNEHGKRSPLNRRLETIDLDLFRIFKYFSISGSFNFIHICDLISVTVFILDNDVSEKRLIIGNPPMSLDEGLSAFAPSSDQDAVKPDWTGYFLRLVDLLESLSSSKLPFAVITGVLRVLGISGTRRLTHYELHSLRDLSRGKACFANEQHAIVYLHNDLRETLNRCHPQSINSGYSRFFTRMLVLAVRGIAWLGCRMRRNTSHNEKSSPRDLL